MDAIQHSPFLRLQVVVCGAHLSEVHGLTYREIEHDGFHIDRKIDMHLTSDAPDAVARSMGLGLAGFGAALKELAPDVLLVVGDRFDMLPAVAAALVAGIPVAHAHGGEATTGAFDDSLRHAITKMSHLHFVAAEPYRDRVIQMGERADRVYVVGGLGLDNLRRLALLSRGELETALDFSLGARSLLVTFHPATTEAGAGPHQLRELLSALVGLRDTRLVFTAPNADPGGSDLRAMLNAFVDERPHARLYASLGQLRYLSLLREVDAVVGNSSSGLLEAPTLGTPTINIGDRQLGRLRAASVIDCAPERAAIAKALRQIYDPAFQARLATVTNPYGDGGAGERIADILASVPLEGLIAKSFHDLEVRVPS
jgi:GDP/UDP-N,N'-diacetylbacillosamine 2-epimerase (hydrolysing)